MVQDEFTSDEPALQLLDEFLSARASGEPVDVDAIAARAGVHAAELRAQIAVVRSMERMSGFLEREPHGDSFGRYQLKHQLGQGGYSRVYLAQDPKLNREVALKVLTVPELGVTDHSVEEARALARCKHDSVVRVYEVGEADGFAYIAMEHVVGTDLMESIRALRGQQGAAQPEGEPTPRAASLAATELASTSARCRLIARVARALAACHGEGIVHRDVKPSNILIDDQGTPKVIDFGLAREQVEPGTDATLRLRGTPAYLAPEQVDQGHSGASPASDQFALGVALYELLTLQHPFRAGRMDQTLEAISRATPIPLRKLKPELPVDVELICEQALQRDPKQRYSSIAGLAEDLEAFLDHRAISVRQPSIGRQVLTTLRRNRRRVYLGCAVLAAALVGWFVIGTYERAALRERIAQRRESVLELEGPGAFRSMFVDIANLEARIQQLGGIDASSWSTSALEVERAELWSIAAQRLNIAQDPPARRIKPNADSRAEFEEHRQAWEGVFQLAEATRPSLADGVSLASHGRVLLPGHGALMPYLDAFPHLPERGEVEQGAGVPPPGLYRYVVEIDGIWRETEFVVRSGEPAWSPRCVPLDPSVAKGMVECPPGAFIGQPANTPYEYPAYLLSASAVTWGELREVFTDKEYGAMVYGFGLQQHRKPNDDEAAVFNWFFAQEYATRVGARLPSPVELWAAWQGDHAQPAEELLGEWVSTQYRDGQGIRFTRSNPDPTAGAEGSYSEDLGNWLENSEVTGMGFRVARTLELP